MHFINHILKFLRTRYPLVSEMKLGKLPKRHDARTLKLARYALGLGTAPGSYDLTKKISALSPMGNVDYGDCTCAAVAHMVQCWTAQWDQEFIATDDEVLDLYSDVTGFNRSDPATDNGANPLDVLNYWRSVGLQGHKLGAYAAVRPDNVSEIKNSIYYFGGCYFGLQLPATAENQEDHWTVVQSNGDGVAGTWGGHAVSAVAYDFSTVTVVSWGRYIKVDWSFVQAYMEEAYACLSPDLLNPATGKSPADFDLAQLQKDLQAISE